jgi:serine/threonine protein kinase
VVYLARRVSDGQQVVIKALPARAAVNEQARQRFLREMEATRALRHKHIITLLDSGSSQGLFYVVLEYCEGGDVSSLMVSRGGKLSLAEARPLLLQTLKALAFAHSQGFVHRDLKPQNILLRGKAGQWSVRLADLGLVKNFEQAGLNGLTLTSEQLGTPFFMPHEQIKHFTPASDVWAMGATCYYILTGSFPRHHDDARDQLNIILEAEAIPIRTRAAHIPRSIAQVIDRALAYDESARYQHAGEMYAALKNAWR